MSTLLELSLMAIKKGDLEDASNYLNQIKILFKEMGIPIPIELQNAENELNALQATMEQP